MPAIRDSISVYNSATGTSIVCPMPAHATGDLMLAFAIYDAGAAVWTTTITNWNHWFTQANGTSTSVVAFWRYAASAADADITIVHTSTADTLTAMVVSIRDAFAGYTAGAGAPVYATTTQAASTRFAMPTVVTPEDNCLLLHFLGTTATAGGVHFVENGAHELVVTDGAAEGLGAGWSYQKTAGTSAADIYACSNATGVGVKSVITIRPPAGGATVIPPYCVSDASIYLNPNGGTAAWDSCTQLAVATTSFGTSLNGKTVNATGTVAAAGDIGINSYHSFLGLTNAATANNMSAAEVTMNAGRYNVADRNILGHFRHPTPAHNQRLTALGTGRGVWFGLKSGATAAANYKVWQVHAADVPMTAGYVQPIVINAANTDTIATNSTITNTDIRKYGWWTGGVGVLTNQACLGPMWAMDTLVLAGGTTSEPITIPDVVSIAATAKERVSSVLQGANQMLCLQMIQFGNGGTDALVLDLNTAAVEFPSQKNAAKKRVNYNGIDNAVGLVFYPGASQTIDMRSAVFSSPSKFMWKFHASSSATSVVQTAGAQVIGGGDVQFAANVPIDQMSFSDCLTITQNGATVTNCALSNSKIISGTPTTAAAISDCTFASPGTGHGIEIGSAAAVPGTPASITLVGISATGYAAYSAGGTSTGNEFLNILYTSGTLTINCDTQLSYKTAGATVNIVTGQRTLTLDGFVTGSDVVILAAGTQTVLHSYYNAATTSTGYTYTYAASTYVDIAVVAQDYLYYLKTSYLLADGNVTLPIDQTIDRNYTA